MSGRTRVREFRRRHVYWKLVHNHKMGRVTKYSARVGLGVDFGNPSIEAILICGVAITLKMIWDSTVKLKTGGIAASQELSMKYGSGHKESVSTGGLPPHKYPLCSIQGTSFFTITRMTMRKLGTKKFWQSYYQPGKIMASMKIMSPGQVRSHF